MSRGHDDYQSEPIRGLPERLPRGERILWQGAPQWWQVARTVFHIRAAAIYFGCLMAWRAHVRMANAGDVHAALSAVLSLLPIVTIGLGLLGLLAWLSSRTTVYTITNRRVVLRIGVALTTSINIPFKLIGAADFRPGSGATGDISLTLRGADRVAYSSLWPHVRPWRLTTPEPLLRAIPNASQVAAILGDALREASPTPSERPATATAANENGVGRQKPQRAPAVGIPVSVSV